jgi:hypothetical protein
MTKMRLLALLAVVALVLFPTIAIAQAPVQPCRFHGTVQVNGVNVADDTEIQALIDGNVVATTVTPAVYGPSSYALLIEQPEGVDYSGKAVTFTIAGTLADQSGNWTIGGNVPLNLTIGQGGGTIPGGVGITKVIAVTLPPGGNATATLSGSVLTIGIPTGATGQNGQPGLQGEQGPAGKSASNVIGIVAIVIAAIALIVAVVVMLRKPQAPRAA